MRAPLRPDRTGPVTSQTHTRGAYPPLTVRTPFFIRALGLAAAATATLALAACGTDRSDEPALAGSPVQTIKKPAPAAEPLVPGRIVAHVKRTAVVRSRPNGPVVARLGTRTEFDSPMVLAIVRREGDWYGVVTPAVPNGRIGWISTRTALGLYENHFRIDVSLRKREVVVHRDTRVTARFPIAIGRPSAPTPVGRFAVTDKLRTSGGASPYGCCILAISAHQRLTPQDWGGGDRIAIHATDHPETIGSALSLGCMRAPEDVMRRLVHLVPLGTLVTVRA